MTESVSKGEWVQISNKVLPPGERASNIPDDTQATPLKMWVKGILQADAKIGDQVQIETVTGRKVEGELVKVRPTFDHSFGNYLPEITEIHLQLNDIMKGDSV